MTTSHGMTAERLADIRYRANQRPYVGWLQELFDHIDAQAAQIDRLSSSLARVRGALLWADGQVDEFPGRKPGEGAFYWRREMMRRAGLQRFVYDKATRTLTTQPEKADDPD